MITMELILYFLFVLCWLIAAGLTYKATFLVDDLWIHLKKSNPNLYDSFLKKQRILGINFVTSRGWSRYKFIYSSHLKDDEIIKQIRHKFKRLQFTAVLFALFGLLIFAQLNR
jgi:hypothetical protein